MSELSLGHYARLLIYPGDAHSVKGRTPMGIDCFTYTFLKLIFCKNSELCRATFFKSSEVYISSRFLQIDLFVNNWFIMCFFLSFYFNYSILFIDSV